MNWRLAHAKLLVGGAVRWEMSLRVRSVTGARTAPKVARLRLIDCHRAAGCRSSAHGPGSRTRRLEWKLDQRIGTNETVSGSLGALNRSPAKAKVCEGCQSRWATFLSCPFSTPAEANALEPWPLVLLLCSAARLAAPSRRIKRLGPALAVM